MAKRHYTPEQVAAMRLKAEGLIKKGVEGYDVKARKKVAIQEPKIVLMKSGRIAIKGKSKETGIGVFRIV